MEKNIEVSNLIQPVKEIFKAINDEWDNFFEIGLYEYLESQSNKYYYTNTFLHRSDKVRFYDIYYPIKATYKGAQTNFSDIESLLRKHSKLVLVGSAGSGKTTLIKHLFLKCLIERNRIPILIELRHLNNYDASIEKLIIEKVIKNKIKPNTTILRRSLTSGKFVFLLDGYDEIFSHKKTEINRQLAEFIDNNSKNAFVISTRPGGGIDIFDRFYEFRVDKLSKSDVFGFIDKIVMEDERNKRIKDVIEDPNNESYLEFLKNPLLLSMFVLAFENHPEIPKKKSAFYRNVFDTLYSKHDGVTKNSFPREKLSNLQRDDFEHLLSIFSYISSISGHYRFTEELLTDLLNRVKPNTDYSFETQKLIYDLRTTISLLILDGFEYYFPHRSMQEYFTALFISKLPSSKKKRAYKNMFDVLEGSSNDNSFTLWHLCEELDSLTFTEEYIIPKLKNVQSRLKITDMNKRLNNFLDIVKPAFFVNHENGKVQILRIRNFENAFLSFCDIYDYKILMDFPSEKKCEEEVKALLTDANKKIFRITPKHRKYKDILIKYDIMLTIDTINNSITRKIEKLIKEINKKTHDIDRLLKL